MRIAIPRKDTRCQKLCKIGFLQLLSVSGNPIKKKEKRRENEKADC